MMNLAGIRNPGAGPHRPGPAELPLPREPQRPARLGPRPRLRRGAVADAAARSAGGFRHRFRAAVLGAQLRRDRSPGAGDQPALKRGGGRGDRDRRGGRFPRHPHRVGRHGVHSPRGCHCPRRPPLFPSDRGRHPPRRPDPSQGEARLAAEGQLRGVGAGDGAFGPGGARRDELCRRHGFGTFNYHE